MSAKLFGPAGIAWGMAAETAILAQSYNRNVQGEERLVKNHAGQTAGVSFYDPMAEHSIAGYVTGGIGGIPAAVFGEVLTIANVKSGNGVSAGLVICSGFTNTLENEDFEQVEANAKQWPLVTAAV